MKKIMHLFKVYLLFGIMGALLFSAIYFVIKELDWQTQGITGYVDSVVVAPKEFSTDLVSEANFTEADKHIGILEIREKDNWMEIRKIPVRFQQVKKLTAKQEEGEETVRVIKEGYGKSFWKISKP